MEIFDISHILVDGMKVWPGDPQFRRRQTLRMAGGDSSNVSEIRLGTHTGTHVDAPLHVGDSGNDVTAIPLSSVIGPARVFRFSGNARISADDLHALDWQGVKRVLFQTRPDACPEDRLEGDFTYLDVSAADFLAEKGMLLVGTDAPSIDPFDSIDLPSHKALLGRGTVLLESARLGGIEPGGYNLICLPLKLAGADGSPVRAVLWR